MKELLVYVAIYYAGFAIAFTIAYHNIKRFKTNDSPWFSAVFSWAIVVAVIVVWFIKLFKGNEP